MGSEAPCFGGGYLVFVPQIQNIIELKGLQLN